MKKNKHEQEANNPFSEENFQNPEESTESQENQAQETAAPQATETDNLKEKYDNLNNQYIRLAADFDNFRKRQSQERESLLKYGTEEALKKVIDVLDNFERAKKAVNDTESCETMKETFVILEKQTLEALGKMGLAVIETEGQKFDPNFHEAVMQTPTDEYPEETIIKELQKGYKLGEKVLRPALVDVAVQ